MDIQAVIFDLDGVLVSTDEYHFLAWQQLATQEGIQFDREVNHRLRGVSRMASLEIILVRAPRTYAEEEKKRLAESKNVTYQRYLENLIPDAVLPGVRPLLDDLKAHGTKLAVFSSSRNAMLILQRSSLTAYFDVCITGNDIQQSKPHPEGFLLAAQRLGISPAQCLVIEDAVAGITGALAAGMQVMAVGQAASDTRAMLAGESLDGCTASDLLHCKGNSAAESG